MKRICLWAGVLWLSIQPVFLQAQIKYEKEYRLKPIAVPDEAIQFIQACSFSRSVKWYREESQDGQSFEAKIKSQGIHYSIEFDSLGFIEDVELKISWDSIPSASKAKIEQYLNAQFDRYRIKKVQLQWTGDARTLQALIRREGPQATYKQKYEIVLRGKSGGEVHWYEILYSAAGEVERTAVFVPRNTDNLDY